MYVYFVQGWGSQLIKIGKTRDPISRLESLQTGSPVKLFLLGAIKCTSDEHAKRVERYAHNIFYKQRRHGEWFKLSLKHVDQIKSLIVRAQDPSFTLPIQSVPKRKIDKRRHTRERSKRVNYVNPVSPAIVATQGNALKCRECSGEGYVWESKCRWCYGTGFMPEEVDEY